MYGRGAWPEEDLDLLYQLSDAGAGADFVPFLDLARSGRQCERGV